MHSKKFFLVFPLLILSLSACNGSPYYTSEAFDARIIDANTGQPIEGALVLAQWPLYKFSLDSPRSGGVLEVLETRTDKDGQFHIPGFTKLNPSMESLREKDPQLLVYKAGYYPTGFASIYPINDIAFLGPKRLSTLAGKELKLKKWDGDDERFATHLSTIRSDLDQVISTCEWTKVPHFIAALDKETKRLYADYPKLIFSGVTIDKLRKSCGMDPTKLREIGK